MKTASYTFLTASISGLRNCFFFFSWDIMLSSSQLDHFPTGLLPYWSPVLYWTPVPIWTPVPYWTPDHYWTPVAYWTPVPYLSLIHI